MYYNSNEICITILTTANWLNAGSLGAKKLNTVYACVLEIAIIIITGMIPLRLDVTCTW